MSTIKLRLGSPGGIAEARVVLPCPPDRLAKTLSDLDEYSENPNLPVELKDVQCEISRLTWCISSMGMDFVNKLDNLNAIAEKLETMSQQQQDIFCGALEIEDARVLNEISNVLANLDSYEITTHIVSDSDLGEHIVNTGKMKFPDYVLPYLDYAAIGAKFREEQHGAYTPSGYVQKAAAEPEQEWEPDENPSPLLLVRMTAPKADAPITLKLPAGDERMDWIMARLGIGDFAEAVILEVESCVEYLNGFVGLDCSSVESINEAARYCDDWLWDTEDQMKLLAVSEAVGVDTWERLLDVAKCLDEYQLYQAQNETQYGRQVIDEYSRSECDILAELEGYIDYSHYGKDKMLKNHAKHTSYGIVACLGNPIPQLESGQNEMETGGMGGLI